MSEPQWNDDLLQNSAEDVLSGIAFRPDMLRDLFALSKLEHTKARAIADKLKGLTGLNDDDSIQALIGKTVEEADQSEVQAIWRALVNLDADKTETLLGTLKKWAAKDEARKAVFTTKAIQQLRENLDVLIADFAAIEMMQKANRLVRDTSGEVQDVKFVCDLRPVFNEDRTSVDAFVMVANLRLIYLGQNGDRSVCEVAMTEEELTNLKEKTEEALSKMRILKSAAASLDTTTNHGGVE